MPGPQQGAERGVGDGFDQHGVRQRLLQASVAGEGLVLVRRGAPDPPEDYGARRAVRRLAESLREGVCEGDDQNEQPDRRGRSEAGLQGGNVKNVPV